jgi:hypothetical protein
MSSWFDRAEKEIEDQYHAGELTLKEYNRAMNDLRRELQQEAYDAADQAYQDVMGY